MKCTWLRFWYEYCTADLHRQRESKADGREGDGSVPDGGSALLPVGSLRLCVATPTFSKLVRES
jgi:hypothetical protein